MDPDTWECKPPWRGMDFNKNKLVLKRHRSSQEKSKDRVFVLSVSSAASINTWDEKPVSLSDLLRRLDDLEKRLKIQERINAEQQRIIRTLKVENEKFENGKKETIISLNKKKQTAKGFNLTTGNKPAIGNETTEIHRMHLRNLKKLPDVHSSHVNCSRKTVWNIKNTKPRRRSVTGGVAFYSYLSHENNPGQHQTIIFDVVITNIGGNYNRHTGTFYCPEDGVYTFSWTIYCSVGGYIYSEIAVNSNAVGAMYCSGQGSENIRHTTGVIVVEINQGDTVYVRTHPTNGISGILHSHPTYRSSFSGWKNF